MIKTYIINIIKLINSINEMIFAPIDNILDKLSFAPWIIDAIKDSIHMLPFLLLIFIFIELIEYFYSEKVNDLTKYSGKAGPLIGSLAASFPQCGFSVIASTLYSKRLITKGTLLAVYLATSDEAIPVILSEPSKVQLIFPLLATKIVIAIIAGYLIDLVLKKSNFETNAKSDDTEEIEEGCCHHHVHKPRKRDLIFHPIEHTINVFIFILLISIGINYLVNRAGGEENLGQYFLHNSILQPVFTAIAGLIPNCAISIAITLMYLKGAIGFGSTIAGLSSSAGLGILVLIKRNQNIKDTINIIIILLSISVLTGIIIQTVYN